MDRVVVVVALDALDNWVLEDEDELMDGEDLEEERDEDDEA